MEELNKEIMRLYNDKNYQELNEYYNKTTIFNILGIERNENRHSSFLKWFFDNRSSHGLGDEPMKKLLRLYASNIGDEDKDGLQTLFMSGDYSILISDLETEKSILRRDKNTTDLETEKGNKNTKGRIDIFGSMEILPGDGSEAKKVILVIENKIYSGERDGQTDEYHKYCEEEFAGAALVEVFLTPEKHDPPKTQSFTHIIYPELLRYVILPISKMSMSTESSIIIADYIRVLGKPSISDNKKDYSIIATSDDEVCKLREIYDEHKELFHQIVYAGNEQYVKCPKEQMDFEKNKGLLKALWDSNVDLFKAILNQIAPEKIESITQHKDKIIRENNRDNTRYFVGLKPKEWLNAKGKPSPKSESSFLIFKSFCLKWKSDYPDKVLTVDILRKTFSGSLNQYYHKRFLNNLFYDFNKEVKVDVESHPLYDTVIKKCSYNWDFYWDDAHRLPIDDCDVRSVKMWRKPDFDRLLERAKELGIIVEPQE